MSWVVEVEMDQLWEVYYCPDLIDVEWRLGNRDLEVSCSGELPIT